MITLPMRKLIRAMPAFVCAFHLIFIVACATTQKTEWEVRPEGRQGRKVHLTAGMSREDVRSLLGRPSAVSQKKVDGEDHELWILNRRYADGFETTTTGFSVAGGRGSMRQAYTKISIHITFVNGLLRNVDVIPITDPPKVPRR